MRGTGPAPPLPDCPEAVAWELLRLILCAEGTPLPELARRAGNDQSTRDYILDLYAECLAAAKGERITARMERGGWRH